MRYALGQGRVHPLQQLDQLSGFSRLQPYQRFVARLVGDIPDTAEDRARLGGEEQAPRPPVGRVRPALDPAGVLHAVDLPHQGHRPDLQEIGETRLIDPFVARDIAEGPALRPGQAEPAAVMIEAAPEQAGDVVDEKPETAFEIQDCTLK